MNEMHEDVALLFTDMLRMVSGFKKNTYSGLFDEFREKHSEYLKEVCNRVSTGEEELFAGQFAAAVSDHAQSMLERTEKKIARENLQLTLNMFMAVYFLPALLEEVNPVKEELALLVCEEWSGHFKEGQIRSASFETIQAGFKSKLCYVTTAVCRSMNKPEDCYELNLLKSYRDRFLLGTKEGEALVHKYYDIAPTIVKRIDKSRRPDEIYLAIWEKYLKPCIALIEKGEDEACSRIYIEMVEELQDIYLITENK